MRGKLIPLLLLLGAVSGGAAAATQVPDAVAAIENAMLDDSVGIAGTPIAGGQAPQQRLQQLVSRLAALDQLERYVKVQALLPEARELAAQLKDGAMQCLIDAVEVNLLNDLEGSQRALPAVERAITAAREAGLDWCVPRLQQVLGRIYTDNGRRAAAVETMESAAAAFEAAGDTLMLAVTRNDLAWTYRKGDDPDTIRVAIQQGEAALAGFDLGRHRLLASNVHHNLAGALLAAGELDAAARHADQAERYSRAIGHVEGMAYIARMQGRVELKRGHAAAALRLFQSARRVFEGTGPAMMRIQLAGLEAEALLALGRAGAAQRVLAEAEAVRAQVNVASQDAEYFRVALEASTAAHDAAGVVQAARAYADALRRRERDENRRVAAELQERYARAQQETENRLLRGEQEVQRTRTQALGALLVLASLLLAGLVTYLVQQRRLRAKLQQRTEQLDASRQALRELGAHNTLLVEEERKRVARELHDDLGQQLVALRMEMAVMKAGGDAGRAPGPEQWQNLYERVERLTSSMRTLVRDLRPPALDGGLQAALAWLGAEYERATGVPCQVEVDPGMRASRTEVETMVFRVAQESLNNVARHAAPSHVSLQLSSGTEGWDLRITDDGSGFDTASPRRGFGLLSMEERAQLLGGRLRIDSEPGRGTRLHLHVPQGSVVEPATSQAKGAAADDLPRSSS
ncbi:MAG TPA: sensor histidine kinase [Roseateles sp.]